MDSILSFSLELFTTLTFNKYQMEYSIIEKKQNKVIILENLETKLSYDLYTLDDGVLLA